MPETTRELTVIVNGVAHRGVYGLSTTMARVADRARHETENVGPPERWELRDAKGVCVPQEWLLDDVLSSAGFNTERFFLSLRAGVAASTASALVEV